MLNKIAVISSNLLLRTKSRIMDSLWKKLEIYKNYISLVILKLHKSFM